MELVEFWDLSWLLLFCTILAIVSSLSLCIAAQLINQVLSLTIDN